MKKYITHAGIIITALIPAVSFAALNGVQDLICSVGRILGQIVPIVFGLALIFFFWGLAQFILKSGDPKNHEEGRNKMIWGVVVLFVMISIYGIINGLGNLINIHPDPAGFNNQGSATACPEN